MVAPRATGILRMVQSTSMPDPQIEKLLILQDADIQLIKLDRDLKNIPLERHRLKVEIEKEEEELEASKTKLMGLEVERKHLENEVSRLEDQVNRYKNQQLQVKKNEEYQALTHEIDRATLLIGELEEKEIGLMLQIDEESVQHRDRRAASDKRVERIRGDIETLNRREEKLQSEREDLEKLVAARRAVVSPEFLQAYDQAKRNLKDRPPFVAPIENGLCKRSNLKVSNELLHSAGVHGTPSFDDATGCLVYIP